MQCDGTWRPTISEHVVKCSECGELLVIEGGRGLTYPPNFTVADALRMASGERALLRVVGQ